MNVDKWRQNAADLKVPPTVAFYCPLAELWEACSAAFPEHVIVLGAHRWTRFELLTAQAACGVVIIPWLRRSPSFGKLAALKLGRPLFPIVLVTRKDADNLRELRSVVVEEVVWLSVLGTELWPAVRLAIARGSLQRLADLIRRADRLPTTLRAGLVHACCAPRPIQSVGELAEIVHQDRSTLWCHWRQSVGTLSTLRLKDVVDWITLLRAAAHIAVGRSVSEAAHAIGVHEDTISRIARRLTGETLSRLSATGEERLHEQFHCAIAPILRPAGHSTLPGNSRRIAVEREHPIR